MKPAFLVVRSGERPFPAGDIPDFDVVERVSHSVETLDPAPARGTFDLLVVTSRAAADRLLARPERTIASTAPVIAVGPATAAHLRSGLGVPVQNGGGSVRRLLESLPTDLGGRRVLLPRGDDSTDELPRALGERGAEVLSLVLYRKRLRPWDASLDSIVGSGRIRVFCATSPSAARWLLDGASAGTRQRLRATPAIALGEATAGTLAARGIAHLEIADPPDFETVAARARDLAGRASPD